MVYPASSVSKPEVDECLTNLLRVSGRPLDEHVEFFRESRFSVSCHYVAPTITNRTRREISTLKNSVQSRFSSIFTEPDPSQPLHFRDSILEAHAGHISAIKHVSFGEAVGRADDALDHEVKYPYGSSSAIDVTDMGLEGEA